MNPGHQITGCRPRGSRGTDPSLTAGAAAPGGPLEQRPRPWTRLIRAGREVAGLVVPHHAGRGWISPKTGDPGDSRQCQQPAVQPTGEMSGSKTASGTAPKQGAADGKTLPTAVPAGRSRTAPTPPAGPARPTTWRPPPRRRRCRSQAATAEAVAPNRSRSPINQHSTAATHEQCHEHVQRRHTALHHVQWLNGQQSRRQRRGRR